MSLIQAPKKIAKLLVSPAFIVFFTLFFALNQNYVYAQENTGIAVSPPTFEISANPGESIRNSIKITNLSDRDLQVVTDKRNFTAIGEEGAVGLTDEETTFSLASWVTISPENTTVEPNSTQIFTFTIDVPLNAEPGGHFGSVVFRTGGGETTGSGASVAQEVASLLLVRIAGDVTEDAEIASFEAMNSFSEYGPVDFEVRVENNGNVHVKPTGTITITNMLGNKVDTFQITPQNVLPGAVRRLPATWDKKYVFGRYTATATLTYGTENTPLVATTTFVGMPYKLVGGALLVGFVALAVLLKGRKRFGKAFKVLFSG